MDKILSSLDNFKDEGWGIVFKKLSAHYVNTVSYEPLSKRLKFTFDDYIVLEEEDEDSQDECGNSFIPLPKKRSR